LFHLLRLYFYSDKLLVFIVYELINDVGYLFIFTKVMSMNIYVGNLSYTSTDNSLRTLFETYGTVTTTKIVTDKFTGSSRGFGFVEMPNNDEGQKAIDGLNGTDFEGRKIVVNESRPREDNGNSRPPRRDGGGGGYNRDGGGRNSRY
jgi:RNA recognition motif-containing protein